MKETLVNEHLAVIDDFLEPEIFQVMSDLVDKRQLHSVHAKGYTPVWRHCDGNPLRSIEYATVQKPGDYIHFSTSLHNLVLDPKFGSIVGSMGKGWKTFTLQTFHYPQGSQLSWHDDDIIYSGSFVFYTNQFWSIWFGGELIVMPPLDHNSENMDSRINAIDRTDMLGQVIYPKPNRLVLIKSGVVHKVARVEPYAGMSVRKSIAGFFMKEE